MDVHSAKCCLCVPGTNCGGWERLGIVGGLLNLGNNVLCLCVGNVFGGGCVMVGSKEKVYVRPQFL